MPETDPFGTELPVIATERLRLRHPRIGDVEDVHAVFGDPVVMRYWSHEPHANLSVSAEYIRNMHEGVAERTRFQWAVTHAADDRLVGTVTLLRWDRTNRHIEVGYALNRSVWGKGYASEAVRGALRFAIEHMNVHRVEAELDPRNLASEKLLKRLGFKEEGLLRARWYLYDEWCDSALYGLLCDEFIEE